MTTPIIRPDLKAIRAELANIVPQDGQPRNRAHLLKVEVPALLLYTEALIAALREARTLIGSGPYMGDIEYDAMFPGTDRLSQRIDALLPPEPQR